MCKRDFTATSRTSVASMKLSPAALVAAAIEFLSARDTNVVASAKNVGLSYKTAAVLWGKMREAASVTPAIHADPVHNLLVAVLSSPPSEQFAGYWQRHKKPSHLGK